MLLRDIVDLDALAAAKAAGHVKEERHPLLPLRILNYTQTCMFANAWTPTTCACRGLIYHAQTGEIVARPFRKFFNHRDPECAGIDLSAPAVVTDKLDGSLGIVYPDPTQPSGYAVATRGSFMSDQALHATAVWNTKYCHVQVPKFATLLVEIIYPDNRVVLDYEGLDDLVFLTAQGLHTGRALLVDPREYGWTGPVAQTFSHRTLADALAAPPRKGAEGMVVYFPDSDERVKVKQADYLALHRLLTKTSQQRIWEFLAVNACKHLVRQPKEWCNVLHLDPEVGAGIVATGDDWQESMLKDVPDEFFTWVHKTVDGLEAAVAERRESIEHSFRHFQQVAPSRKEFARLAQLKADGPALFLLLNDRSIDAYIWLACKPVGRDVTWLDRSEDVA